MLQACQELTVQACNAVQVAVALKGAVYLWNASSGSIETVRP